MSDPNQVNATTVCLFTKGGAAHRLLQRSGQEPWTHSADHRKFLDAMIC